MSKSTYATELERSEAASKVFQRALPFMVGLVIGVLMLAVAEKFSLHWSVSMVGSVLIGLGVVVTAVSVSTYVEINNSPVREG
ncbi:hypothetical protein DZC31_30980 (plasmid) [Stenotrophomonas rhizophila]|nr:hypothetical protein DZC31_30980 [Stenotrophomonas rhizophila]